MQIGAVKEIAFIDLEASGLSARSWPIEVGWRLLGGKHAAFLVKPQPEWDMGAWDPQAEALHGVSHHKLVKKGSDPKIICKALNEALEGCTVYSDAPDWDGFWLYRLFQAAKFRQAFYLTDFREAFAGLGDDEIQKLMAEAMKKAPHTHRASDDVLHMKTLFDLAARRR